MGISFQGDSVIKNLPVIAGDLDSIPRLERSPEEEMAPTPVFLPGKSHVQRSLVGCSSWGLKESNVSEYVCMHSGGMIKGHDHI